MGPETPEAVRMMLERMWAYGYATGQRHGQDAARLAEQHYTESLRAKDGDCQAAIAQMFPAAPPASAP